MKALQNILLIICLFCSGCALLVAGGVAAVGTYTYTQGQLICVYNANLDTSYNAVVSGVQALGMPVLDPQKGISSASVNTLDGERDVWITLKAKSSTTTEIAVRVGYFGDEFVSQRIHDSIKTKF